MKCLDLKACDPSLKTGVREGRKEGNQEKR